MLYKLTNAMKQGHGPIKILLPGVPLNTGDSGIGSIGRIDHADMPPGSFIAMHPHINDEILSYFRSGRVRHTDSVGNTEFITNRKLMLMKAGKAFYHEEKILEDEGKIEGLQIFIRPEKKDLDPVVDFYDLEDIHSVNQWRMIASPETGDGLMKFRSQTYIYDIKIEGNNSIFLPQLPQDNLTLLLYVFQGNILVDDFLSVAKAESVIIKNEINTIIKTDNAELVLFCTDENAEVYDQGMYSGNKI